MLKFKHL